VTALALSHNQRFCVTGGGDARVRVWDMRSREMVSAFVEHGGPISGVSLYRDDAHLLTCSQDKSFMCWDLRREARISQHTQRSGGINAIGISRDQVGRAV
jgi:WD40 repeat protein